MNGLLAIAVEELAQRPQQVRAAAGAVLLLAALALVPAARALAQWTFPGRHVFFARWGFSHLFVVAASFLVGGFLAGVLARALGTSTPGAPGPLAGLGTTVLVLGITALACVGIARRTEPGGARALGLPGTGAVRAAASGVATYVLLLPGVLGVALLWPHVLELLGLEHRPQDVLLELLALEGPAFAAAIFLAVVVLPLLEELIFRGFLQPLLTQNLRDAGGVMVTSFVFASLHGSSAFGPVFALSLILGGVMLRTRRLASVWAVHGLHNALTIAMVHLVPGVDELVRST